VPEACYCLRLHHLLLLLLLMPEACCLCKGLLLLPLLLLLQMLLNKILQLLVALCKLRLAQLPRCLQLPEIRLLFAFSAHVFLCWFSWLCISICSSLCFTCCCCCCCWACAATTLALAACSSLLSCTCNSGLLCIRHAAINDYTVVCISCSICPFWRGFICTSSVLVC
jgi:hypothetical protein